MTKKENRRPNRIVRARLRIISDMRSVFVKCSEAQIQVEKLEKVGEIDHDTARNVWTALESILGDAEAIVADCIPPMSVKEIIRQVQGREPLPDELSAPQRPTTRRSDKD